MKDVNCLSNAKKMIYADHAATTALDPDAFETMKPFLLSEYGNASQPYSFSRKSKIALKKAREQIASCIHAEPEEIFFTSGGTESDNWVINGITAFSQGSSILTSQIEHHAILNACQSVERLGYRSEYVPVNPNGLVEPDQLKSMIHEHTHLISIMLANNEVGSIQPIETLVKIAHEKGIYFHTDAVQAMGHIPIDVKKLGADFLSASGHKFNGPKGIGFLYIKKGTYLPSFMNGGSQEKGQRAGTENIASIVGMAAALEKNCKNLNQNMRKLMLLEEVFWQKMAQSSLDYLHNGTKEHLPGCINVSFRGADGEMLLHRLDLMGICVSTGSACDSNNTKISHVLQAMHLPEVYAKGTIRISLGYENTIEDVEKIVKALETILQRYE